MIILPDTKIYIKNTEEFGFHTVNSETQYVVYKVINNFVIFKTDKGLRSTHIDNVKIVYNKENYEAYGGII